MKISTHNDKALVKSQRHSGKEDTKQRYFAA